MPSSPYALILSAIMTLKKGVLFAVVLFSSLLGIGDCAGGGWFSWPGKKFLGLYARDDLILEAAATPFNITDLSSHKSSDRT